MTKKKRKRRRRRRKRRRRKRRRRKIQDREARIFLVNSAETCYGHVYSVTQKKQVTVEKKWISAGIDLD
jgi:hypothetical protein